MQHLPEIQNKMIDMSFYFLYLMDDEKAAKKLNDMKMDSDPAKAILQTFENVRNNTGLDGRELTVFSQPE